MSGKIVVLQENKLFWGAPSVTGPCLEVQLRGVRSMMLVPAATLAREKNVTSTKAEGAPYNQDIMRRLSSTVMQRALEDSVQNLPVGATAVAKVAAGSCLLIPAGTLAWEQAVGEQSIALRIPLPMLGGGGMPDITNLVTGGDEKETAERMIFETNLRRYRRTLSAVSILALANHWRDQRFGLQRLRRNGRQCSQSLHQTFLCSP